MKIKVFMQSQPCLLGDAETYQELGEFTADRDEAMRWMGDTMTIFLDEGRAIIAIPTELRISRGGRSAKMWVKFAGYSLSTFTRAPKVDTTKNRG